MSIGSNLTGFSDKDLVASHQTARGAFVRLRMKFDEDVFGRPGASKKNP